MVKEGRWDKSEIDYARQEQIAAEAKRRGISEATLEAAKAVPTDLVRDLVSDFRRGVPGPSSIAGAPTVQHKKQGGSGWSEPLPLSNPPGVDLADKLMDQQDQIDRL